ncbi:MAG: hypothetical protein U5N58_02955 [Actinomycetota bacterium]|nr:hypothetical protein [Actinomycetota bacterium]
MKKQSFTGYKGTIQRNIDRLSKSLSMHQQRKQKLIASIREFRENMKPALQFTWITWRTTRTLKMP